MIQYNQAIINNLIYYRIKEDNIDPITDAHAFNFEEEDKEVILNNIFLKSAGNAASVFEFNHHSDVELNPLFTIAKNIHQGDASFTEKAQEILDHLNHVSTHPNIKEGDLFIIHFTNIRYKSELVDGLGIYKIEKKDSFLETGEDESGKVHIHFKKGIGTGKIDKQCVILFTDEPYTVFVNESNNEETKFWNTEFIDLKLKADNVNHTNQVMELTRQFIVDQMPNEYEMNKVDQVDLLKRSHTFFKNNDNFEQENFEQVVFNNNAEVVKSYREFDQEYKDNNGMEINDAFEISNASVKKQARYFKSIIKLDKNFSVYVHGDRKLIEQGSDEDGRKFYKLYFTEEH